MFKIGSMSSEFGSDPTVRKLSASSIHWEGQNQARGPRGSSEGGATRCSRMYHHPKIGSMSSDFGSDPTVRKLLASSIHWEGQNQARSPRGSLKARAFSWARAPHGPHGAHGAHGPHAAHGAHGAHGPMGPMGPWVPWDLQMSECLNVW